MSTTASHVHVAGHRVLVAAAITLLAAVIEIWVSRRAGSLFLVADAVHLIFRWIDPALSLGIVIWLFVWAGRLLVRRARQGRRVWHGLS